MPRTKGREPTPSDSAHTVAPTSNDHADAIRSVLDSLPYTAPEVLSPKVERLMEATLGLLRSLGYEVRSVEAVRVAEPEVPRG